MLKGARRFAAAVGDDTPVPDGRIAHVEISDNSIGFAGYEFEPTTSQWMVRHRVLDSTLGRWLSRDPIGYVDGMSLYGYVSSSPSAMTDPMGLSPEIDAAVQQHNAYLAEVWALYKSGTISPCEASRLSNLSNENTLGRIERAEQLSDRWDVKLSASAKALGNSTVDTVVSGVTLGFVDGVEVWTPNAYEQSAYGTAYGFARVSSEIGFGLALGAAQGVKGASALTRFVSGSMFALDMGGNAVSFGRGAYSMYEDGITWENALQAGGGLAGFSGNMGGLFRAKPSLHATHVAENTFHYGNKILGQSTRRGWTDALMDQTISRPHHTSPATNKATGGDATAYFRRDGTYLVRDNTTHEIVQISNRNDTKWITDDSITHPYLPK